MRRLGWKFWLVTSLIIGAMAFASLASDDQEDLVLIRAVAARVEQRCKVVTQRSSAVYGELHDGEAREHYARALELLAPSAASSETIGAGAWRDIARAAVAEVRVGAHCRSVAGSVSMVDVDMWARAIWSLCLPLLEGDEDLEAVEVWLDGMVMVVDADTAPDGVRAFTHDWTDARIASLSAPARQQLLQGLVWLGDKLAQPIDWERSLAPTALMTCSGPLFSSDSWLDQLMAWDSGFSPQRKAMKAFATAFRALPVLSPVAERWSDRTRQFDEFLREVEAVYENTGWAALLRYREVWRRQSLARLRLLGAAVTIHNGDVPEPIADPLGDGAISITYRSDRWELSAGRDVLTCNRTVEK